MLSRARYAAACSLKKIETSKAHAIFRALTDDTNVCRPDSNRFAGAVQAAVVLLAAGGGCFIRMSGGADQGANQTHERYRR